MHIYVYIPWNFVFSSANFQGWDQWVKGLKSFEVLSVASWVVPSHHPSAIPEFVYFCRVNIVFKGLLIRRFKITPKFAPCLPPRAYSCVNFHSSPFLVVFLISSNINLNCLIITNVSFVLQKCAGAGNSKDGQARFPHPQYQVWPLCFWSSSKEPGSSHTPAPRERSGRRLDSSGSMSGVPTSFTGAHLLWMSHKRLAQSQPLQQAVCFLPSQILLLWPSLQHSC